MTTARFDDNLSETTRSANASHLDENGMPLINRKIQSFTVGSLIGCLGGLIGLGGAEFRLPVLVGLFKLGTLEAVILNKAMSLVVVSVALLFRLKSISLDSLVHHQGVVINLLTGSLIGAWWAAGHAITMSRAWLDRIIMILLAGLAIVMLVESTWGLHADGALFANTTSQFAAGVAAGLLIGIVAALLGVAGGELLIPTIVLLYGLDVKIAGSLSLCVSLPTMVVGFARYRQSDSFKVLRAEGSLLRWMSMGSILGAAAGGLMLSWVPTGALTLGLGVILLISAVKTFMHAK